MKIQIVRNDGTLFWATHDEPSNLKSMESGSPNDPESLETTIGAYVILSTQANWLVQHIGFAQYDADVTSQPPSSLEP